jgi:hypothetical protein
MDEKSFPPQVLRALALFTEQSNPGRLSRNLRGMLISLLIVQKDGYGFDMDDLLLDLSFLFEFLDVLEDE